MSSPRSPHTGGASTLSSRTIQDLTSWLSARSTIAVIPIRDPVIEALGHPPTHEYAEQFWLPVIGPSALWALRRLTSEFSMQPSGYQLNLSALGRDIGLGAGTGRNSAIVRTVSRLVDFHLAAILDDRLGVHTHLPPLSRHQVARLPDHLAERHRLLRVRHNRLSDGPVVELGP